MYVCVLMALTTTLVLCARSQDLVTSMSVRRVHVVVSTAGFKGGGKPCRKTRDTAALRRGVQKAGFEPKPLVHRLRAHTHRATRAPNHGR